MSLTTIFALFGDDIRLWFTTKEADIYFDAGLVASFLLFSIEILINSCVVDDFKYSFFFWLDLIATMSLISDIGWVIEYIQFLMAMQLNSELADASIGKITTSSGEGARAAKALKSLRLIRLIRIIKLYKYAVKSNNEVEEAKLRE